MKRNFSRRMISSAIMLAMSVSSAAQAPSIAVDARHASATVLKEAANGTRVVDIATPSQAGVSHNRFTNFNVDNAGVILNNSHNPVQTQLGGWIDGNRRLAGGEANIILNEVTGLSRSQLQGYVEIAGKSAEFILANPNGITCNGCGFINTPRITLVTGKPDVAGGSINGFNVSGGDFLLEGRGLDASTADRFDLITRAARLNADIYAKQLNIVTGRNRVDYQTGEITVIDHGDNDAEFEFALDASALGAMYANNIHLVGTEKGLGVNSEGLVQSVSDLEIDVNGDVRLKNLVANDSVRIRANEGSVELGEKAYATHVDILATENIVNRGLLAAAETISLRASDVAQLGELYVGLNNDGSLNADGALQVNIENAFENKGTLYAGNRFELQARALDNSGGHISFGASSAFDLDGDLINREGTIHFRGESGSLVANAIDNHGGTLSLAGSGNLELTARASIDNDKGVISAENTVSLSAEQFSNIEGAIVARDITLDAESLDNRAGTIDARQLQISAATLSNHDGQLIARDETARSLTLDISRHLDNSDGFIYTAGQSLAITTDQFTNRDGVLSTADNTLLDITVRDQLDNRGGSIQAAQISIDAEELDNSEGSIGASSVVITAQNIINDEGYLQGETITLTAEKYRSAGGVLLAFGSSGNVLDLNVSQLIENTLEGIIQANSGNLTLAADALNNRSGVISLKGKGVLSLDGQVDNTDGFISAAATLLITGQQLNNNRGEITADHLTLNARALDNKGGLVYARALSVHTGNLDNEAGKLIADQALSLQLSTLHNQQGLVHTGGTDFTLYADSINNQGGTISHAGSGQLLLSAGSIQNRQGKITGDGSLQLTVDQLVNNTGFISALDSLTLTGSALDNSSGKILSGDTIFVSTQTLDNHEGYIQGKGLTLNSDTLNNTAGALVVSGGDLAVILTGTLDNHGGTISGDGSVLLQAAGLNNDDGEISGNQLTLALNTLSNRGGLVQGNELSLTVPELINTGGTIAAVAIDGAGLALSINGLLENSGGLLLNRGQQFSVDAHTLINHGGEILHTGTGSLVLRAGVLNNDLGTVQSNTDLSVYVQGVVDVSNRAGTLSAVDHLIIDTLAGFDNTDGQLLAGESLTVSSKHLDNQNGLLSATVVSVSADTIDNTGHGVIEAETLALHADTLTNSGILLATGNIGQSLEFDINNFINTGRLESHGVDLLLNNINLHSDGGQIIHQGEGELRIVASGTFDNRDGTLATRGVLNFQADAIDNRAGQLIAGKQLDITIDAINNQGGLIQSGDGLSLVLQDFDNSQGGQVLIGGSTAARLNVSRFFNNQDGSVIYQGDSSLTLNAGSFNNVDGILGGSGNLDIIIDDLFDNTDGQVIGEALVRMTAGELLNRGEGYLEADRLQLAVDQIVNENVIFASGTSGESLVLNAANIINRGLIESHGTDFNLLDVGLDNTDGVLVHRGDGNLLIHQQSLINDNGLIAGHGNVSLSIAELYNAAGEILSDNGLVLSGELFENRGGVLQADQLNIQVNRIENTDDGWLIALGDDTSTLVADQLTNHNSQIIANASLTIEADTFDNFTGFLEADTLSVTAGQFDNSGAINATSLNINASTLINQESGELLAGYLHLEADALDNLGLILAYGTSSAGLDIVARAVQNSGTIESHGNHLNLSASQMLINSGDIYHQGNGALLLESAWLDNREGAIAGSQLVLNTDTLDNRHGQIYAENQLIINALAVDNRTGVLQADQQLLLTANSFDNREEGVLFAKQQAGLTLTSLDNRDGTITGKNFNILAGTLLNQSGEILVERLQLTGIDLDNTEGVIATTDEKDGSLVISFDNSLINQRGLIQTDGATASIHTGLLDNTGGDIFHLGGDALSLIADRLINNGGNLYSEHNLAITADTLSNNDGNIFAGNWLDISAAHLLNRGGSLSSGEYLSLTLNTLINAGSQTDADIEGLISADHVTLAVDSLDNLEGGRIQGNHLTITGAELTNNSIIASYAEADNAFVLAFDQIYNSGHLESSGENWRIDAGLLTNNGGVILHRGDGDLLLFIDHLINHNDGLIDAGNRLEVQAQAIDNTHGFIIARGESASLINADRLDNTGGYINANDLTISGVTLTNEKGEISGKNLSLQVNTITNLDGSMIADQLAIQANRLDNLKSESGNSYIHATDLTINADLLNNQALIQGQQLTLAGGALHNDNGEILALGETGQSLQLNFSQQITNRDGRLESWGSDLHIAGNLDNQDGQIILAGSGVLSLENLTGNAFGEILSLGDLVITPDAIHQFVNNQLGILQAAGNIILTAAGVNNIDGNILAGNQLSITATTLDNTDGLLLSTGTGDNALALRVSDVIDNTRGQIETHADNFALTSYNIINAGGEIRHLGEGTFSIQSDGSFTNDRGELGTMGNMDIRLDGAFINDGKLIAMKDLFIAATDISNLTSRLISAADIHFLADNTWNQGTTQSDSFRIDGGSLDNRAGTLLVLGETDNSVILNLDQFDNRDGGLLEIHGGNNTLTANILNDKGKIINLGEGSLTFSGLNNQGGLVLSTGDLAFTQPLLDNRDGVLQTAGNLTAAIDELINWNGVLQAGQWLDIQARAVDNSQSGALLSGEGFRLTASESIINSGGRIESLADAMYIDTALLMNEKGFLTHAGSGELVLAVEGDIHNNGGKIATGGNLSLDVDRIFNNRLDDQHALISAVNLALTANELQNLGGYIQATEQLSFTLPQLNNHGGYILSGGSGDNALVLNVGLIDNRAGVMEIHSNHITFDNIAFDNRDAGILNHLGSGSLTFSGAGNLQNAGGILQSAGELTIFQQNLDNRGGQINAAVVDLFLGSALDNRDKGKVAGNRLSVEADSIDNRDGILAGFGNLDDALQLHVNLLDNSYGTLRSGADSWVLNLDSLINTGGSIFHTGNEQLTLTSDYLLTTSGTIASTANLSIIAQGLENSGQLIADKNINLSSGADILNQTGAAIKAGQILTIDGAGDFINQGEAVALEGISLTLEGLLNNQGRIITDGLLATINASNLVNSGTIAQNNIDGSLILTASDITLDAGIIKTDGSLVFNATDIANKAIISADSFTATGFNQFENLAGATTEAGRVNFQGCSFTNEGNFAATHTDNALILDVSDTVNRGTLVSNSVNQSFMGNFTNPGEFRHAGSGILTLGNAGSVNLQGGNISTAGTANLSGTLTGAGNLFAQTAININSSGTFNNLGSTLYTKGALTINSAVNNQSGQLLADGNLRIQTSGAVNNSSHGVIQGRALTISAGSINNTGGGTITSTGTAAGSISAGSINNQGGKIASANQSFALTSTTGNINNTSGSISHTGSGVLTVNAKTDLTNNNNGKILTSGSLTALVTNLLSNTNDGEITAGSFILKANELNNSNDGKINAVATTNTVSEIIVSTLNNSAGTIGTNNHGLNIETSSALNNSGGSIAHAGSGLLSIIAPAMTNNTESSQIKANGSLNLLTQGHFNNGGIISAAGNLSIGAIANNLSQVSNSHKITSSGGEVNIVTTEKITNSGTIEGHQKVALKTGDIANSGTIKSLNEVNLDMTRLSLTGTILADELLRLNVKESVSIGVGEELSTKGSLILITEGDITNAGKIAAEKSLELGGINLFNSNQINGGAGQSKLTFTGNITNNGTITSDDRLEIRTGKYTNNGMTAAANNLTLIASNSIDNTTGKVIFSGGDMTLGTNGSINNTNNATIFSIGNMTLEGASGGGSKSQRLNNVDSRIESMGSMAIHSHLIDNQRNGVEYTAGQAVTSSSSSERSVAPVNHQGRDAVVWLVSKTTTITTPYTVTANGQDAVIKSGGNMLLNGGNITNNYGTIFSGDRLTLNGLNLNLNAYVDTAAVTTIREERTQYVVGGSPSHGGEIIFSQTTSSNTSSKEVPLNTNPMGTIRAVNGISGSLAGQLDIHLESPGTANPLSINTGVSGSGSGGVSGNGVGSANGSQAVADSRSGSARDTSSGDQQYNGRVDGGPMGAGDNVVIDLTDPDVLDFLSEIDVQVSPEYLASIGKENALVYSNGQFHVVDKSDVTSYEEGVLSFSDATLAVGSTSSVTVYDAKSALQSAQNITIGDVETNSGSGFSGANGAVDDPLSLVSNSGSIQDIELNNALFGLVGSMVGDTGNSVNRDVDGASVETISITAAGNIAADSKHAKDAEQKNSDSANPDPLVIDVASGNPKVGNPGGLYVTNSSPDSNYLVETRPEFTQYSNFLGSDYLLNALGYDPDKTIKRLGDAFYENQLIRDELSKQANTRFVSGASNDQEQMELLMNNAVAASSALELSVGISLSADQVAALTEDIVWLVEKTVNGEKVLVPTLYLASIDKNNLTHEGTLIATGGDMDIHAAQGINLKGKNSAGGTVNLSTDGDFTNAGDLSAAVGVNLSAGNDFVNTGDITGSWISAAAENNFTTSGSLSAADILLKSGGNFDNAGSISALTHTWITAGDTLTNHSSGSIIADGLLSMTATNDLINRQGHLEGFDVYLKSTDGSIINRTEFQQTTLGTSVRTTVGDSSTIISHNSLTMDAGKDLDLQGSNFKAASDIQLSAGNDILLNGIERTTVSSWSNGKQSVASSTTSWDVVSLDAGGNLILSAGRDITGQGSQLSAGNIASLTAGRDVNLEAVANTTHSEDTRSRKQVIDTTVTHTLASITSGAGTSIKAGQDINLIGATIDAGGSVLLHAERDTNLVAVNDSEYHYDYTKQKKSFGRSKTTINETLSETTVGGAINAGGSVLINAQGSDAGLLKLNSGNVNIIGGAITAGDHVLISADEDINILASTYNELDFHSTSKSGFGGLSKKAAGQVEENTLLNRAGIEATGGNVSLLSGNNIALIAADVTAGGNINMEAVDQLLIGAGEAVNQSASWSKSSGLFSGGNIYSSKEAKAGEAITSGEGSVLKAGGRITGDSGSAKIIGSDLHGEDGGVQLLTDIGSIEVLASKATSQSYSYEKSMTVGMGDLVEGLSNPNDLIKNQDGRLTAKIADATYDEVDTKTSITTMTGSNITSGTGNIHLQSADSILIEGSNLEAGKNNPEAREGDVNLVAVNDVTVREVTDTLDTETKEIHGKAELSVVVQHQAVEVVKAVIAVDDARDQLEQAKKDYKKYERDLESLNNTLASLESDYANKVPGVNYADILELREIVADMKGDEDWYVAGVALAAANLAAKTTALVQQTAAAAQSTATYGFNAGLQLDIEASKTNTTLNETTAVASNISGNNVRIQTGSLDENGKLVSNGTTTTIQGSHIDANNKISISTGELNILASRDTREYSSETEQGHITAQMTVYGASGGASVNADFSRSKAGESSTTINNSTLDADKISITTTDDTNIRGGNVHADSELTASIGGDLNVESLQDRHRTKNNSAGVSAGVSFGGNGSDAGRQNLSNVGGASGVNGGLNASNGMSVTRETVLSSLTSGGTANINVAGNTQITGALIATIDENGNDLGQLTLNTGSLSFTDLTNIHQSNQTSGSISTSISLGGQSGTEAAQQIPTAQDGQGRDSRFNTTNIAYSNTSQYDADKSLATLGSGNINVGGVQLEVDGQLTDAGLADGSPLDRLNRDTTNLNKDLWSVERSEGNIDLQIDHRMFSAEGRKEIREQFDKLPDNLETVASNLVNDIEKILDPGAGKRIASNAEIMSQVREHLAGLSEEERQQMMQFVGVFIDGTQNDKDRDTPKGAETNVAILSDLYQMTSGDDSLYYAGVATDWYSSLVCGLTGCGGQVRINKALKEIKDQWGGGENDILVIDVTGFSRGSTQSLELINTILKNGIPGVPQDQIVINGAYLFDTVSSTGLPGNNIDMGYTLTVPDVVSVFHATADNEYRGLFGLQSQLYSDGSSPPNVTELGFFGAHSNIGGGYAPEEQGKHNTLSTIPLQWMHGQAVNNNAPLAPIPPQYQVPPELQSLYDAAQAGDESAITELNEKYIHDSRYFWEKWQDRDSRPIYFPRGNKDED